MVKVIRDFLDTSTDKCSVFHKVGDEVGISKDLLFNDVMSFMFGGHETSSRAFTTGIYQLKKNPDLLNKIKAEIDTVVFQHGKYGIKDLKDIVDGPLLDSCEYLGYFVKEILRFSPPAGRSLGYVTSKQVTMKDGLVIPKDQIVCLNIMGAHTHKDEWQRPKEFLPDRFDPESPLFTRPDGGKRSANAYCPFTFGKSLTL